MQFPIATVISIPLIVMASCWNPDELGNVVSAMPSAILENAETNRPTVVASLSPLSFLTGDWKGVAQPKRGSNSGAWSEESHAAWHFDGKIPCLLLTLKPGNKYFQIFFAASSETARPIIELRQRGQPSMLLELTEPEKSAALDSTAQADESRRNHWAFESIATPDEPRIRVTVRKISEIRVAMLFEESANPEASWRRHYEVGMTREGRRLASGNTGERKCIVTGGLGSIPVTHAGKTWFVCCEGCKQAFAADPEGTIAAYRQRLREIPPSRND